MAPRAGSVVAADGLDAVRSDPLVVRAVLPLPARAARPVDNEVYLGHVVVAGPRGGTARAHAEALVGSLRLRMADGAEVAPLGVPSGLG